MEINVHCSSSSSGDGRRRRRRRRRLVVLPSFPSRLFVWEGISCG